MSMEVSDSESDKPPGKFKPSSLSIFRWLKKIFSLKKKISLTSEEREKQIEESIERFASRVSSEDNVLEKDEREMIHGVLELGAGISHHHGIGRVRRDALPGELGESGIAVLRAVKRALDPGYLLNPGALLPEEDAS